MSTNGNVIPTGTKSSHTASILEKLSAAGRNFDTFKDVAFHGISGEPIDDKTYLMENVIQAVAGPGIDRKVSDTLTQKFLSQLWDDLQHPPQSYLGYDYAFRKADGSHNNIQWPHVGKAGQPYARSVRPKKMQPLRPDPSVIFDSVLERKKFHPHPNKISSVLFYVASIIIHDCFHTSHKDYAISETSSYLDLAPLYGSNEEQQASVRTFKDGKLKADCFADSRIHGFPPGVGCLLIMFNRFHNNVVENLAKIDEGGRFSQILDSNPESRRRTGLTRPPTRSEDKKRDEYGNLLEDTSRTPQQDYDEALFQTGRLITCGLYINVVLQDYVRTILGLNRVDSLWNLDPRAEYEEAIFGKKIPEAGGNQVSAEFSLVYRWHSCVSQDDEKWTDKLLDELKGKYKLPKDAPTMQIIGAAADWADNLVKTPPQDRPFENLQRDKNGKFSDNDLAEIWIHAVDDMAGAFGAQHVPSNLKFVEVLSVMQARRWNLASLNEFREYFKLAPHKTFESINPDPAVARALEHLYGHPDNVEIYPGIVVESAKTSMSPGSGLCASWTTSRAILSDAVSLVRGDRFYTVDYTPNNLTNWGFQQASSDQNINWGGVLYKLVLNAFPTIPKNSIYAHFPLVNPPENKKLLASMGRDALFNFSRPLPKPAPIKIQASSDLGAAALSTSSEFISLWPSRAAVFDPPAEIVKAPVEIELSFAEAVLKNSKYRAITTQFYQTTLEDLWKQKQYELGGYKTIDVVKDVLNAAHVLYITSVLGIPLNPDEKDKSKAGVLANLGRVFEHAYSNNPQPKGLASPVRRFTQFFAGAIEMVIKGPPKPDNKAGELGKSALAEMAKVNGASAATLAWQDILPTAALILTTAARFSAAAVEAAVPPPATRRSNPPQNGPKTSDLSIAVRATVDAKDVDEGQKVNVNISNVATAKKLSPDIELATEIGAAVAEAITDIVKKTGNVSRMPGPQGLIKTIRSSSGDVKFLNAEESEYVAYPVSMKVRWK